MRETNHGVDEFILPVALDAGNADDLAAADVEAHTLDSLVSAIVPDMDVVTRECDGSHLHLDLWNLEDDVAADHHASQFLFVCVLLVDDALQFPATQDRDTVSDLHDLFQLVTDEQDRLSLCLQLAHGHKQVDGFLRGEDGRWLIEDEDLRPPSQYFEDLDTLLDADGQVAHESRGVHSQ